MAPAMPGARIYADHCAMVDEDRNQPTPAAGGDESEDALRTTADHWRSGGGGTPAEDDAAEVAEGAERGAEQAGWGREGN